MAGNESEYFVGAKSQEMHTITGYIIVVGPLALSGLIGNIIAFRTFGKMAPENAITFLLRALAVIDSCVLLCGSTLLYAYSLTHYVDIRIKRISTAMWPFIIVFIPPLGNIAIVANIWTTVAIGMNRYVAVCRPLQAARLCTVSRARKQVLCIIIFSIVYGIPRFFEYKLTTAADGSGYDAEVLIDNDKWYYFIYHVGCKALFCFLIPLAMLTFSFVRLITSLRASKRCPMEHHGGRHAKRRVNTMLVVLLGVFLACHIPNHLHSILSTVFVHGLHHPTPKAVNILGDILNVILLVNSSVNWVIYFMYNREFRKLQCKRCTNRTQQGRDYEMNEVRYWWYTHSLKLSKIVFKVRKFNITLRVVFIHSLYFGSPGVFTFLEHDVSVDLQWYRLLTSWSCESSDHSDVKDA